MIKKTNTQKMLGHFFTYPLKETYLRELSRELKLSMPAVTASVHNLGKEGLVTITRGKALTTVKANVAHPFFRRLKRVHNLEQLYLSGLTDFILKNEDEPQAIVCFGSYSRGEDTEQSDVDIAVVGGSQREIDTASFDKTLKRGVSIHLVDLKKISKEFHNNLCNGIVLEGAL